MRQITLILVALLTTISTVSQAQNLEKEEQKMRAGIHELINAKRSIYLQAPLKLNDSLNAIAQRHSEAMAAGKVPLGHHGVDARDALIRKYFPDARGSGENVTEAESAEEAIENWWTSDGHKAIMLGDYTDTGIGVVQRGSLWYCTQIFMQL